MALLLDADEWQEDREQLWRSLNLYTLYRIALALLLLFLGALQPHAAPGGGHPLAFVLVAAAYLLLGLGFSLLARDYRLAFHLQLSVQVITDVSVLTLLGFLAGGLQSGLPLLTLVALAGAGLIAKGRLVMFYAAMAAVVLLGAQTLAYGLGRAASSDFFAAAMLSLAYFAVAVATHRLARLARVSEALVRQQALDLANLAQVNEAVLAAMQDAVLVVDADHHIRLTNPRTLDLLGPLPPVPGGADLAAYSADLDQRLWAWRAGHAAAATDLLRSPVSGRDLRPRFTQIGEGERQGISVFLEDVTDAQELSRQTKLAALGRLTANIAHEIRNPLAAISHAAELLGEDYPRDPVEQKLIRIISDNTVRLNNLVNEVLQLNRRDRAQPEPIDADTWFAEWLDTFCAAERVPAEWVQREFAPGLTLLFDRNQFHQVLWNLVRNAVRHSRQQAGSVRLCLDRAPGEQGLQLDVLDDGPGVPPEQVGKLFEPFFTTDSQGTGLGLYIARELSMANGATLDYVEFAPGAQFRLLLREP